MLDIRVAYKEDVDRVIAVLRQLGEEIGTDPEWEALLIDKPEILGVQNLTETAVVIRMVTKTLPLKQWEVGRELRRRIKKRFDEEKIEIPFPHMTLYWGEGQMNTKMDSETRAVAGQGRDETGHGAAGAAVPALGSNRLGD